MIELGLLSRQPAVRYPGTVQDVDAGREAARWLRQQFGNDLDPFDSLTAVCEHAGQLVLVADIPGEGASLLDGDVAVAVISRIPDPGRWRATAAHELGHLVLGDEYSADLGVAASRDERERVIDAFAAELLLPGDVLIKHRPGHSAEIRPWLVTFAARYRTSWSMAVRQAAWTGLIDSATARSLRSANPTRAELMEALGWAPQVDLESVTVPPSYAHAVMQAWDRALVTSDRAVELMHGQISLEDLPPRDEVELAP